MGEIKHTANNGCNYESKVVDLNGFGEISMEMSESYHLELLRVNTTSRDGQMIISKDKRL